MSLSAKAKKIKISCSSRSIYTSSLCRAMRMRRFFFLFFKALWKSRPHYWLLTIHCWRQYSVFNKLSFNSWVQQNNWPQKEDKWVGCPELMIRIHFPVSLYSYFSIQWFFRSFLVSFTIYNTFCPAISTRPSSFHSWFREWKILIWCFYNLILILII